MRVQAVNAGMLHAERPVHTEPHEAMQRVLDIADSMTSWWGEYVRKLTPNQLSELSSYGVTVPGFALRQYAESIDRLHDVAASYLKAGVQERQVAISEAQGKQLAMVIRALLHDEELGLSDDQRAIAPALVRKHLLALQLVAGDPS